MIAKPQGANGGGVAFFENEPDDGPALLRVYLNAPFNGFWSRGSNMLLPMVLSLVIFGQNRAPAQPGADELKAYPVAKVQAQDRPVEEGSFSFNGMPTTPGFHVQYRIKGKNILAMQGVELETLIGPDGKNRAADWNKENLAKTSQPRLDMNTIFFGSYPGFLVSVSEGQFGKLDLYQMKGHAKVLVGVELAKVSAVVRGDSIEVKTDPGFTLQYDPYGKGILGGQAIQPGQGWILNPNDFLGALQMASGPPMASLMVRGPLHNIRAIREKGQKLPFQDQFAQEEKELRLMIPRSDEPKRTFVIEYWKEIKEIKIPFQL